MYTFATHFLCAKIVYKCVLLLYICLHKQTAGKCGHYRRCTYSKHRAKHEIDLKQTWSKLRKCSLYAIFATLCYPRKSIFSSSDSFIFLTYTIVKSFGLSDSNISVCWKQHHSLINLQNFHFSTVTMFNVTPKSSYISTMLFLCW